MSRLGPIPRCKGCGSQNLQAEASAVIGSSYDTPVGVDGDDLVFRYSFSGEGEHERWRIYCGDCGRRMRTNLAPVPAPDGKDDHR